MTGDPAHVGLYRPASMSASTSLPTGHQTSAPFPSLTLFNHWRMKRAEEKRKEAHDVTWVCVSFGCLLGPRAESPPQTPSSVWKQLLPSHMNVSPTNQGSLNWPHNLLLQPESGFLLLGPSPSNIPFYFLQLRFHRYAVFGFLLSLPYSGPFYPCLYIQLQLISDASRAVTVPRVSTPTRELLAGYTNTINPNLSSIS